LRPLEIALNEKQIPQFVETIETKVGNGMLRMAYRAPKAGATRLRYAST